MSTVRDIRPRWFALVILGAVAGFLSGLFGVGGGVLVVPALLLMGVDQRRAAGSSVAAILPTAVVGAVSYGLAGQVDWVAGILLAVGAVVGAQLGSMLLVRLPREVLFWGFVGLLVLVAVSLWISIPARDAQIELTPLAIAGLVVSGLVIGTLSALFGVGGGIILVPTLTFAFGAGDLIAKGTSLLMMVPGSISATVANSRRHNVDFVIAGLVGLPACVMSPLGLLAAAALPPVWSNIAFSALVIAVTIQLVMKHLRSTVGPR